MIGLVDEPKGSCADTRRIETCVAPRRVDALRGAPLAICFFCSLLYAPHMFLFCFLVFFPDGPTETLLQTKCGGVFFLGWGREARCQLFSFYFNFPVNAVQQTLSGIDTK